MVENNDENKNKPHCESLEDFSIQLLIISYLVKWYAGIWGILR